MQNLSKILCERTAKIEKDIQEENIILNESTINSSREKKELSQNASEQGNFYSSASYCFGNNIFLKYSFYQQSKLKMESINTLFSYLQDKNSALQEQLNQEEIETISSLQAVMVVKERANDVQQQINLFQENKANYTLEEIYSILAYTEERYFSALSWYQFINMPGKKYLLDQEQIADSCTQKISEAQERYQYVNIYLEADLLKHLEEQINGAEEARTEQEYELCLMQASQAKAEADAILSSAGLGEDSLPDFLASKSKAVEKVIAENSAEGIFPILGYSYYQYAQSLEKSQPFNALIYYEYALEMSDLSLYFPEEERSSKVTIWFSEKWEYFGVGLGVGILLMLIPLIFLKITKNKIKSRNSKSKK
jgi:predicted S18 family serine protease